MNGGKPMRTTKATAAEAAELAAVHLTDDDRRSLAEARAAADAAQLDADDLRTLDELRAGLVRTENQSDGSGDQISGAGGADQ